MRGFLDDPLADARMAVAEQRRELPQALFAPQLEERLGRLKAQARFRRAQQGFASGWMRIRQRAKQGGVELPLIISDHADWDELTMTIRELAPTEVWITHGREEALKHWCMTHQIKACELNLVGYEDEDD